MKDSEDQPRKGSTGETPRRGGQGTGKSSQGRRRQSGPIPGTLPKEGGKAKPARKTSASKSAAGGAIPGTLSGAGTSKATSAATPHATKPRTESTSQGKKAHVRSTGGQQSGKSRSASTRPSGSRSPSSTRATRPAPSKKSAKATKEKASLASRVPFLSRKADATERTPEQAKRRRLIVTAIVIALIAILVVGAGIYLYAQLNKRSEQIVAETQQDNFEVVPCEPGMLDMTVSRTGSVAGSPVSFGITMTNNGEQPCSLDAGSEHLVLEVTSGNDEIWASNHCTTGGSTMYVFGPGVSATVDVHWSGARSNANCDSGLPSPNPGTYVVTGYIDGVEFPELRESFVLTDSNGIAPAEETTTDEEATSEEESDQPTSDEPTEEATTIEPPPEDHEYVPD